MTILGRDAPGTYWNLARSGKATLVSSTSIGYPLALNGHRSGDGGAAETAQ
ncbi:hypothetical protein [Mycobacterium phage WXIN]|nr:hypothetical protein [Mycobacterium phage WXIN]